MSEINGLVFEIDSDKKEASLVEVKDFVEQAIIPTEYEGYPVTSISWSAFLGCERVIRIEIPASVKCIESDFAWCEKLKEIKVAEGNENYKSIDGHLYTKDGNILVKYAIGKEDSSFAIPTSVTSIGDFAFKSCENLVSIEIPASVTSIGVEAFCYSQSLTKIKFLKSSQLKSIGKEAFFHCEKLTSIEIPSNVISIGDNPFCWCKRLKEIKVAEDNETYKSIDGNLYTKDGKALIQYAIGKEETLLIIPSSVTTISEKAFSDCEKLARIEIPASVNSIGKDAFLWCESLDEIKVSEDNETYKSIDGNLYSKDGKTLVQYAIGKKETLFTISSSVMSVGESAVSDCINLKKVTFEKGSQLQSIGKGAFSGCENLISVEIPAGVTSIGEEAFIWCDNLKKVKFTDTKGWYRREDIGEEPREEKVGVWWPSRNARRLKGRDTYCVYFKKNN